MNKYTVTLFEKEPITVNATGYYETEALISFYVFIGLSKYDVASFNKGNVLSIIMEDVSADGTKAIANQPTV